MTCENSLDSIYKLREGIDNDSPSAISKHISSNSNVVNAVNLEATRRNS